MSPWACSSVKPFRTYSAIRVRETGSGPGSLMVSHERPRSASVQTASPRQCQCRSSAIASRAVEAGGIGTPSRERRRAGRSCGEHEDDRHSTLAPTNEAGSVSIATSTTGGIGERGPMSALLTCERTTPTADIDGQHVHSLIGVTLPASRCWSGRAAAARRRTPLLLPALLLVYGATTVEYAHCRREWCVSTGSSPSRRRSRYNRTLAWESRMGRIA